MKNRVVVEPFELERLRARASDLRADVGSDKGWTVDTQTAPATVALFSALALDDRARLVTLASLSGLGDVGWTCAFLEEAELPASDQLALAGSNFPAPPAGALASVMDVITGDGSLWSYLQASILRRELEALGVPWWHEQNWDTHLLLGNGDTPLTPVGCDDDRGPIESDFEWQWESPPPIDWRPFAERGTAGITVGFWTVSAHKRYTISRHADRYERGSLRPVASTVDWIATGPEGFIF